MAPEPEAIIIIIVFVVILVIAFLYDQKANVKYKKMIEEQYPMKAALGDLIVTEKGELLYRLPSGTVLGYKKWNLSDIGYIGFSSVKIRTGAVSVRMREFCFRDRDGKILRGEYLTRSKKPLLQKSQFNFDFNGDADQLVAFLQRYGPHIQSYDG